MLAEVELASRANKSNVQSYMLSVSLRKHQLTLTASLVCSTWTNPAVTQDVKTSRKSWLTATSIR